MSAPGRNDPCPCGSGQKYKKCCLPKAEAERAEARPARTGRETVMPKLLRFADDPQFDQDHDVAEALFWGEYLQDLSDEEFGALVMSDDGQVKYNAWFVWDLDIEDGITVADMFLQQRGRSLTPAERAYADRMRRSHLSLYQVESVEEERGVGLRDLFTKEQVFVHERTGSQQLVQWDLVGARVVEHGDGRAVFEGGLYLYAAADKSELLRTFKRYERRYVKDFPNEDHAAFLKRAGMVFNHLWLDLVVFRPLPSLRTAEGDELVFARSVYDVRDPAAFRAALEDRDDIELGEDGTITWFEDDGEFRRMLGTLRIGDSSLTVETTSRERDARAREWLAGVAPGLTDHRTTALETVAEALANRPSRSARKPASDLPPDVAAEIEQHLQDEYYRKWIDEPVPALRGATPRQAAASRKLRPILIDLLREMQNRYERARKRGDAGYDPGWLWSELGVR